ncbi:sigma-54-dependent transcriptional regulator [Pseudoalteromonas fenneropenaei]|uniref:Sigma-54-dependent transcriptional regulator n=1 Tax=Pseudoalteromonas fenneropenaei TaxID=1737459 RepID=A0ABV7CKW5_9GAMM
MDLCFENGFLDKSYLSNKYPDGVIVPNNLISLCLGVSNCSEIPVLISGETGTGKGFLVKYIHQLRKEKEGSVPCISINCALINNDVADSMIFGHKKGAFTGATEDSDGAVGKSEGGIFFLDEIHCLNIETQKKLLRVLDDGSYTRVGESLERKANFQLIVATNVDLSKLVVEGKFLLDLLMRIKGIDIFLPPLRQRLDELSDLIALYFDKHNLKIQISDFNQIVENFSTRLWPGNVRQLYSVLDSMRFKARVNDDLYFCKYIPGLDESLDGFLIGNESKVNSTDSRSEEIEEIIKHVSRVCVEPIHLEWLTERIEAMLIRYTMSRSSSIFDVMNHLGLSRGKLDFKRRKYDLMFSCNSFDEKLIGNNKSKSSLVRY